MLNTLNLLYMFWMREENGICDHGGFHGFCLNTTLLTNTVLYYTFYVVCGPCFVLMLLLLCVFIIDCHPF